MLMAKARPMHVSVHRGTMVAIDALKGLPARSAPCLQHEAGLGTPRVLMGREGIDVVACLATLGRTWPGSP
jgi:hypothetical protein